MGRDRDRRQAGSKDKDDKDDARSNASSEGWEVKKKTGPGTKYVPPRRDETQPKKTSKSRSSSEESSKGSDAGSRSSREKAPQDGPKKWVPPSMRKKLEEEDKAK